ncbi:MAG: hypothetical protein JXR76_19075 [Deltaproteobacteria bacterium]|nr:hypothetical protein [Deltaproteobacteria bacterium]
MNRAQLFIFVILLIPWPSVAQQSTSYSNSVEPRQVLVHPGNHLELGSRLSSELRLQGFNPIIIESDENKSESTATSSLSADAAQQLFKLHNAIAIMEISKKGNSVRILLVDDALRPEVNATALDDNTQALLAFRAVDLLKHVLPAPSKSLSGETSPVSENQAPDASPADVPSSTLAVLLQPGIVYGFGSMPPAFQGVLGGIVRISTGVQMSIYFQLPFMGMHLDNRAGETYLSVAMSVCQLEKVWTPKTNWAIHLGAGFGVAFMRTKVEFESSDSEHKRVVVSPSTQLSAGFSLETGPRTRLRFDFASGFLIRDIEIEVPNAEPTTWGRPFVSGFVGLQLWLL